MPCVWPRCAGAAEERGFEFVGTTLAVSPYQLFETCNDVLERLAAARGLTPVVRDFAALPRCDASFARAWHVSTELLRLPVLPSRWPMDRARIRDERKAAKK